jgi:hypothetical protein
MNKGDRAVLQKNHKEMRYGEVVTVLEALQGNKLMVRYIDEIMGIDVHLIRKASVDEVIGVENQLIVNPNYRNGQPHVLIEENVVDELDIGDVGFIVGVEIKENENDDIFRLDFGNKVLKVDKKFMDNYTKPYRFD